MCCLLAFCTVWRRARLWLELFANTVGWFLSQLSYLSSYVFLRWRRSWIVTKRLPFLGMNILKISFQFSTYTAKKTPFRSEIMRYNDLEQTNTLFLRENRNQNTSIKFCECYLHTCRLNQLGTHGCSRISILISVILNSLLRILSHVFYSSHSAYYVWLCSFLKLMQPSDLEA